MAADRSFVDQSPPFGSIGSFNLHRSFDEHTPFVGNAALAGGGAADAQALAAMVHGTGLRFSTCRLNLSHPSCLTKIAYMYVLSRQIDESRV